MLMALLDLRRLRQRLTSIDTIDTKKNINIFFVTETREKENFLQKPLISKPSIAFVPFSRQ